MSAVRKSDGLHNIVAITFRDAADDVRTIVTAKMRNAANAAKTIFSGLSASASPATASGYAAANVPVAAAVGPFTVTVTGGAGTSVIAWEAPAGWNFSDAAAATVTAFSPDMNPYEGADAALRAKVTDASGAETYSNFVYAYAYNLGGGGGGVIP